MKTTFITLFLFSSVIISAQKPLFHLYADSAELVIDANAIKDKYLTTIKNIDANITLSAQAILNTTPYLVYWDDSLKTVNLPQWRQVIPEQQRFFTELNKSEKEGKKMFGLFFNGFYIIHELGHCLEWNQMNLGKKLSKGLYESEYFANTVAILFWRKMKRQKELKQCYQFAKKFIQELPNPVPKGENEVEYFNKNYEALSSDPYKYGYFQFHQFVKVYEDKSLKSFDEYIKSALVKTQ